MTLQQIYILWVLNFKIYLSILLIQTLFGISNKCRNESALTWHSHSPNGIVGLKSKWSPKIYESCVIIFSVRSSENLSWLTVCLLGEFFPNVYKPDWVSKTVSHWKLNQIVWQWSTQEFRWNVNLLMRNFLKWVDTF